MQLNPYLLFNGQCEAAFKFYAQCLGGKIEAMLPHAGTPAEEHSPPEWRDKILHDLSECGRPTVDGLGRSASALRTTQGLLRIAST
jgi:PhnB protein